MRAKIAKFSPVNTGQLYLITITNTWKKFNYKYKLNTDNWIVFQLQIQILNLYFKYNYNYMHATHAMTIHACIVMQYMQYIHACHIQ